MVGNGAFKVFLNLVQKNVVNGNLPVSAVEDHIVVKVDGPKEDIHHGQKESGDATPML